MVVARSWLGVPQFFEAETETLKTFMSRVPLKRKPLARHPAPSDLRKGSSESPPWPSQEKLDQSFVPACLLYIQCQVVWRHGEHLGSPIHVTNVLEEYMYACWLVHGCFGAWLGWLIEHGGPLGGFWRGRCWFVDELLPQQRGINGDKAKELNPLNGLLAYRQGRCEAKAITEHPPHINSIFPSDTTPSRNIALYTLETG
ncbi:hypothetical protein P167DRAFT_544444 [Morchella conica CCBAS932]|uniref:Uncharacterized protein n=1 Tax=Morchella conica CCBAS932 TaxID=1392247 RepID=A0A3N4KTH8_9PEZI|nr:hypothetical protein P167DRAFT_544444 [Morchella conica CCBAS932]